MVAAEPAFPSEGLPNLTDSKQHPSSAGLGLWATGVGQWERAVPQQLRKAALHMQKSPCASNGLRLGRASSSERDTKQVSFLFLLSFH